MKNIIVVGSSYFERYVEQIETANLFPQAKLFFVSDHGNSMNIDIGYLIDLIKKEGIQAIVLGPFDYEQVEPYVDIPCYVVQPNIQDFLLLHNKVENYQKAAVVLSRRYEIDLTALEESLHIRYNKYYYPSDEGVSSLIAELKRQGFMEVIGNSTSVDTAQKMGLRAHYYFSRKCIEDGISNALQIIRNLDRACGQRRGDAGHQPVAEPDGAAGRGRAVHEGDDAAQPLLCDAEQLGCVPLYKGRGLERRRSHPSGDLRQGDRRHGGVSERREQPRSASLCAEHGICQLQREFYRRGGQLCWIPAVCGGSV